ncbi:hypothetical protein P3875_11575 [Myroides sp. JBRI-B21084]|uniref:hypothetical protein n=1 Tax=Myroides sp. JBRI-B21084 TaxID=3119977 RepID=UPI0026E347F0|nr:hypothetical protein [Paenimyroides cloacae]WKW46397.1 hypothetical protein P3875_11575 [Paenimyroides cloacae]
MKKNWWVLFVILMVSCTTKTEPLNTTFYFWRTNFKLSATEKDYLTHLKVRKLYVRYFDIGLQNGQAIPVAPIVFNDSPKKYNIVPVIYIKNEVFLQPNQTDSLPNKVYKYIQQINQSAAINVEEIQFDCDWSLQSKQNYFKFLEDFKKLHSNLSATIRLHQVKYPQKTGIPPVNKGVLMYYNMGVIGADDENSIYNKKIAEKYIASLQNYSLPLNIALPIFSWGVHVRNNQVANLIGGLKETDFKGYPLKKIKENRFIVTSDVVFNDRYLAKNDEIKLEFVTKKQLGEMMRDLKKYSKQKPNEIIYYDLNEKNLKTYEKQNFKAISSW